MSLSLISNVNRSFISQSFLIIQINNLSVLSEMSNRELKTQKSVGWTELGQEFIDACYQGDEAEVGNLLTIAGAKKRDFNTQDQYRKGVMMTLSTLQSDWSIFVGFVLFFWCRAKNRLSSIKSEQKLHYVWDLATFLLAAGKPSFTDFLSFFEVTFLLFTPKPQFSNFEQIEKFWENRAILSKLRNFEKIEQFWAN